MRSLALGVLLVALLALAGCIDNSTAAFYADGHVAEISQVAGELAPMLEAGSVAAAKLEQIAWHATRAERWTTEIKSGAGNPEVIPEIPAGPEDVTAVQAEDYAIYEYRADLEAAKSLPFASGWGGALAGSLGGGGALTIAGIGWQLLKRWQNRIRDESSDQLRQAQQDVEIFRKRSLSLHKALDQVKATNETAKAAVVEVTKANPDLDLSYREYQADQARRKQDWAQQHLPGVA